MKHTIAFVTYPFRLVAKALLWAFCSRQETRNVGYDEFVTNFAAFMSAKTLNQPFGDGVFGCIHVDPGYQYKPNMLEKLLGFQTYRGAGGGTMEIRESESRTSFEVVTRSAKENSSDYIHGMAKIIHLCFCDMLAFAAFIALPYLPNNSSAFGLTVLLALINLATFIIHFYTNPQAALYRLLYDMVVCLTWRY